MDCERRFKGEAWTSWPFSTFAKGYFLAKAWAREASTGVSGLRKDRQELIAFLAEQILEVVSPAKFPFTNPEVLDATREQKGEKLKRGLRNFFEDNKRKRDNELVSGTENFQVGHDLAVTPGKVIYENSLIELLQYAPRTEEVGVEPVIIVPA